LIAGGVVAEIGDLKRFDHPRKLMAYLGLVPSEHPSGGKRRVGASLCTKDMEISNVSGSMFPTILSP